ncbi:hypothetical protein V6N13_021966 [Hibiscus sabdariffa]|uniref:Uncharacterized protein n=1 Tax=Hibiscus sabdariffa TaxID=183260 RepID=A0ABR2CQ65_9ROSI
MGVSNPPPLAISFRPLLLNLPFPFLGSQILGRLYSFVVSEVWSSSFEKHRRPSLGFGPGKGNEWLRVGVGKGRGSDDRWIGKSLFRFTDFLYESYNASSVVVFLCWDRTKDMAIYSDNKARSEHHLWWTVVKWFGSEIRCNVSEIKDQSPFVRARVRSQKQDAQCKGTPWSLSNGHYCRWIVLAFGPLLSKQSDFLLFSSFYLCMPEVQSCKAVYLHQNVVTCSNLEIVSISILGSKKPFIPFLCLGEYIAMESIKILDNFVLQIKILWYCIRLTVVVVSIKGVKRVELLVVIFFLGLRRVKTRLDFRSLYIMFFIVEEPRAEETTPETSKTPCSSSGSSNEMLADDLDKDHPRPA